MTDFGLIARLKEDYTRLVDDKAWATLVECFTDDFEFEGQWTCTGAEAFVDRMSGQLAAARTEHRLGAPGIELESPDSAAAVWPFSDVIDQRREGSGIYRSGSGEYHERYRRDRGRWRIASMRIVRSQVECTVFVSGVALRRETVFSNEALTEWLARARGDLAKLVDEPG